MGGKTTELKRATNEQSTTLHWIREKVEESSVTTLDLEKKTSSASGAVNQVMQAMGHINTVVEKNQSRITELLGLIEVPGYSAIAVTISFFAALNMFGLGVVGSYVWRAFENTKGRPQSIVMAKYEFKRREDH